METKKCLNCQTEMQENAEFCSHCGQKNTDGKVSFLDMIKDLFDSVFNLNSKTFSTILYLFVPGKLTEEYFRGKHKAYSNPIRIFLVTSLVFMAVIFNFDLSDVKVLDTEIQQRLLSKDYRSKLDTVITITKSKIDTPAANTTLDTLSAVWNKKWNTYGDSVDLKHFLPVENNERMVAVIDFEKLSIDEIIEKYHFTDNNFFTRIYTKQVITFLKKSDSNSSFINYLLSKFTWMLFALIPVIALLFKLFYIRHKRYYVEHLVFNFHTHAFYFLFVAFLVLAYPLLNATIIKILITAAILYLPFAIKRYYKQGWRKTIFKLFLLSFGYIISFFIVTVLFLLLSFLLF